MNEQNFVFVGLMDIMGETIPVIEYKSKNKTKRVMLLKSFCNITKVLRCSVERIIREDYEIIEGKNIFNIIDNKYLVECLLKSGSINKKMIASSTKMMVINEECCIRLYRNIKRKPLTLKEFYKKPVRKLYFI